MKRARKFQQISMQVRFGGYKMNSSSYVKLLIPQPKVYFIGYCLSYVLCKIDFYILADQISNSIVKWVLDTLCGTLALNSVWHQEFWPVSNEGQPQTLTPVNCFLLIWFPVKSK